MKIAARFPVKSSPLFAAMILLMHLFMVLAGWINFALSWQMGVLLVAISLSASYSLSRYRELTQAPDDLCWSGENWLIQADGHTYYLQLEPASWMSRFACLLHFSAGNKRFYWLFTRYSLGSRSYSELCFLAKQNLSAQQKQDKTKTRKEC